MLLFACSFFWGNAALSISYVNLLIVMGIGWIIMPVKPKWNILQSGTSILLVGTYLISIFSSDSIGPGIQKLSKMAPFLLFPILFSVHARYLNQNEFIRLLKRTFFVSGGFSMTVVIAIGIVRYTYTGNSLFLTYDELASPLAIQPIYFALYTVLALLFGVEELKEGASRRTYLVLGSVLLLGIVLLSSRISWVLLVIVLTIKFSLTFGFQRKIWLKVSLVALVLCTLIFSLDTLRERLLQSDENVVTYSGFQFRSKLCRSAGEVFKDQPILGYGIHRSDDALMQYYEDNMFRRAIRIKANAHNQYLQTGLDAGLLGLFLWLYFLIYPFFLSNRLGHNFILFMLMMVLVSFGESFLRRYNGVLFLCYFYQILLLDTGSKRER